MEGLRWLRLSSVLPSYFTPELLDAVTTVPVMAPHLHLPAARSWRPLEGG